jgi:hypothetical protein
MSATDTAKKIKELKKTAHMERIASEYLKKLGYMETQEMALKLENSSLEKLKLIKNLKTKSRLDALRVYSVEMTKRVRKGKDKTYIYWYAAWRTDGKVKKVYLGPVNKMSRKEALKKARDLKAKDLNIDL